MQALFVLSIFFGALVAITIAGEMPDEKIKIANECKDKEKATDADVQGFLTHRTPDTPTGKCLAACIYEKLGAIKDGKIDGAAIKAGMAKEHVGNDKMDKPPFDEVVDECQSITNSDRCELAAQLTECMHKGFAGRSGAKKN